MTKRNKTVFLSLALATMISMGVISSASAYRGDFTKEGPNYSAERHSIMEKAFETNDYNLWKSQMVGRGVTNVINEGNFSKFAQAHQLADAGKYDEASKIREELGLRVSGGMGGGRMQNGMHQGRNQ